MIEVIIPSQDGKGRLICKRGKKLTLLYECSMILECVRGSGHFKIDGCQPLQIQEGDELMVTIKSDLTKYQIRKFKQQLRGLLK